MSYLRQLDDDDFERYYANTVFVLNGKYLVRYLGGGSYYKSDGTLNGVERDSGFELASSAVMSIDLPELGYYKDCLAAYASRIPLRSLHKGLCIENVTFTVDEDVARAAGCGQSFAAPPNAGQFVLIPPECMPWRTAAEEVLGGIRFHAILDRHTALVCRWAGGNPRIKHKGVPIGELLPSGKVLAYRGTCNIFKQTEGLRGIDFTLNRDAEVCPENASVETMGV
jgi:hypothetical protein